MEYIIIVLFGIFIGVAVTGYMFIERIEELKNDKYELRQQNRELRYKLEEIEDIIRYSDKNKESFAITVSKIKKELVCDYQSKNQF